MPLFETTIQINHQEVAKIVKEHWDITLGKLIKGSQNHTFEGTKVNSQGQQLKFSIRVTPDPQHKSKQRIQDEIFFVNFLSQHKLNHICHPIPQLKSENDFVYCDQKLIIVVFEWAKGQLLNFIEFQWMKNKEIVFAWGKFFAELHKISRLFENQHKQVAQRIQNWNQIHHGVLADVKLHQDDQKQVGNAQNFGVIHGDLNCSNFFYDKKQKTLYVFDTDQVQRGFYLWDVSQAIFTSYMLQNAGMPISGTPVPEANRKQFQSWIVEGYESVAGKGWVNLERLERMVMMKKLFYVKFCTQAVQQGNIPADMKPFIEYVANTLGKQV